MDRKTILALAISFFLILAWGPFVNYLYPPKPLPKNTNTVAIATNALAGKPPELRPGTNPPSEVLPGSLAVSNLTARKLAEEQLVVLENESARYEFTSHGGGLKSVELKQYPEAVTCGKNARRQTNALATLNRGAIAPALAFFDTGALEEDGIYQLQKEGPILRAEKVTSSGLAIRKEFRLSTNYLVKALVRLQNQTGEPLRVPDQEYVLGTASPIEPTEDRSMQGFYWFDGAKAESINESYFANRTLGCFAGTPRGEYQAGSSNVIWAAVHNQFFTMLAMPARPAYQVISRRVPLAAISLPTNQPPTRATVPQVGYQTGFIYPSVILAPGQSIERQYDLFAGPKEYNTVRRLGNRQELVMNFGGFFGFFAQALLLSMNGLNSLGISYGAAIVVITVIIKLLFWPLTNASTKSMKRMATLQPQMNALREKYKDDPRKMNMKLMEFMKENHVSPLGGCLPLLLQIPVFFGFFTMIKTAIELRGARFLWVCDLSKPDTLFTVPGAGIPFNLLPLIMGVTMLWQARLTPVSPGVDPVQQKMMKYMPLMMLLFLYNFSAGLTLYWTVQNLLSIAQMKLTRMQPETPAAAPRPPARPAAPAPGPRRKKDKQT